MGFEPAKCPEDCAFRVVINGGYFPMCGYMSYTGELRGCDPGPGCKRYIKWRTRYKKGKSPTWDVDKGKKLWQEGYSDSQIGKQLGVSRGAVAGYRQRNWGDINRERKKKGWAEGDR